MESNMQIDKYIRSWRRVCNHSVTFLASMRLSSLPLLLLIAFAYVHSFGTLCCIGAMRSHYKYMKGASLEMNAVGNSRAKTFKRYMQIHTWQNPELEALYPILCSIESSCRDINRLMRRISTDNLGGLAGGKVNIQGEEQKQLDVIANRIMKTSLCGSGKMSIIASKKKMNLACVLM